jgi:putative ABC transport system substrate-binding protein
MRRPDFMRVMAGAGSTWPFGAWPQDSRMRRIGILWPYPEADPDSRSRIASLRQALQDLGWAEGRSLRIDYRWGASADDPDRIRRYATEMVALAPDMIAAGFELLINRKAPKALDLDVPPALRALVDEVIE